MKLSRQIAFSFLLILLLFIRTPLCHCQESNSQKAADDQVEEPTSTPEQSVEIVVDNSEALESEGRDKSLYVQTLDALLSNPALSAGLQSGAGAINRSIDALMESLFYSLLDNEIKVPVGQNTKVAAGYFRDVFTAGARGYVIVDRFKFGPEFAREIGKIGRYPTSLGAEGGIELLDIYLKSDAERIAQDQDAGELQYWVQNLFGLVPLFSSTLPPSFNPLELHDPLRQFETPGVFPADIASFNEMPSHSIRSYQISGVVRLPITLQAIKSDILAAAFDRVSDKLAVIPYTVFTGGSYRINVLKKSESTAWVGLTKIKEVGNEISTVIGDYLYAFSRIIPELTLTGIKTPIFPLDSTLNHKILNQYDHLYEFNIKDPTARKAYLTAVRGDFKDATELARKSKSVRFHFTRTKIADQFNSKHFNQLFVYNRASTNTSETARIEINDEKGRFNILEGTNFQSKGDWNLLVGEQQSVFTQASELEVLKSKDNRITWRNRDNKSVSMSLNLEITDRYTSLKEYAEYVKLLQTFSGINLSDLPNFKQHQLETQQKWKNQVSYSPLTSYHDIPHIPDPVGGSFNARVSVFLNPQDLHYLAELPRQKILEGIKSAFDLKAKFLNTINNRFSHIYGGAYNGLYHFLRFFTVSSEFLQKATSAHQAFYYHKELKKSSNSPEDFRDSLMSFFSSNKPELFMKALREWLKGRKYPVNMSIGTKPQNQSDPGIRQLFGSLNGKLIDNGVPFPSTSRYRIAKSKINAFLPNHLKDQRKRIHLIRASFSDQSVSDQANLHISIDSDNFPKNRDEMRVYIKVQQAGKVQFGKLVLIEEILTLPVVHDEIDLDSATSSFFVTGPQSPFKNFLLQQALDFGGEFRVSLSISTKDYAWSHVTQFTFKYEDGQVSN